MTHGRTAFPNTFFLQELTKLSQHATTINTICTRNDDGDGDHTNPATELGLDCADFFFLTLIFPLFKMICCTGDAIFESLRVASLATVFILGVFRGAGSCGVCNCCGGDDGFDGGVASGSLSLIMDGILIMDGGVLRLYGIGRAF